MAEASRGEVSHFVDKNIKDPDLPIIWPHEEEEGTKSAFKFRIPHISDYGNGLRGQAEAMRRLNGEAAVPLADKYLFVALMKQLGYTTPEQTLVTTDQNTQERRDQVAEYFPNPDQAVICKPHDGHGGIGIVELSAGDLPEFIPALSQDYIIQERVPITAEIRYARQVDENAGIIRRIYDEKKIPKVAGDGEKTKRQLIRQGEVPWYSKIMTAVANRSSLGDVVPEGSSVHLSFFGIPHKEESELEWSEAKKQRVANIDMFMKRFTADIQTKLGTELPYLCFDIGVIDSSVIDRKYESEDEAFEVLKKNLVPFESQMPFSAYGYLKRSSESGSHRRHMMKNVLGTVMTGRKEDFLKDSSSKLTRETHKSAFGGNIEITRVKPENPKTDVPVFFAGGIGKTAEDDEPYLHEFAKHGREAFTLEYQGRRKLDMTLAEMKTEKGKVRIFKHQLKKATSLIASMDEMEIDKIDAVVQSEAALHVLLAASLYPERFRSIIFAYPAGIGGLDFGTGVASRVAHQTVRDNFFKGIRALKKPEQPEEKLKGPNRLIPKGMMSHPIRTVAEGVTVSYSNFWKILHQMRQSDNAPKVAIVAGKEDVIYYPSKLLSKVDTAEDFDYFEVTDTGHGMGYRKAAFNQLEQLLTDLQDKSNSKEATEESEVPKP